MNARAIKVPTQAQVDSGKAPRGWHMERLSDGVVLVKDGYRAEVIDASNVTAAEGEYAWLSFKTWPTKSELDAMRGES
jgi:hypothetical protein